MIAKITPDRRSFWSFLLSIDQNLAERGKPRGKDVLAAVDCIIVLTTRAQGGRSWPEGYRCRFSPCCERDGCRKRVTATVSAFSRQKGLPECRRHPG